MIWIIILGLILIAFIIIFICQVKSDNNKIKQLNKQLTEELKKWGTLQQEIVQFKLNNEELKENNIYLKNQLEVALQNNKNAEENLNSRYTALMENVAAAEVRLEQVSKQVEERTNELNTVAAAFKELDDKANEVRAQSVAAASELNSYKVELQQIIKELDDAKETNRSLTLNASKNKLNWFDFGLSNKEIKLIETIAEISGLYPELTKDMATIEWKKIWLPKFQDLANTANLAVRGIYRLVLKRDENISYVGQAVNIKERWYEHAKKMLGADTKGTEKLYNYRPEDFYWTVLETNTSDLNSAERYWIEYYCCKEVGLNKK